MFRQFWIGRAEDDRAHDLLAQEMSVYNFYRARKLQSKFIEKWGVEGPANAGNFCEFGKGKLGFSKILLGHFAEAFFAEQCEMYSGSQGAERLIRANVGRGFFAANMLFASGEGQDEATVSIDVGSLTGKAAGHLTDKFFARGNHADERAPVARRQTKALAFERDNVCFDWRTDNAERNAFRDRDHPQRTGSGPETGPRGQGLHT